MEDKTRMTMVQRRLKKHMEENGLSQNDVAAVMNLTQQNVSYSLNSKLQLQFLLSYLEIYPDLDIYYLFGFNRPENRGGDMVNEPSPENYDAKRKRILSKLDEILKDELP